MFSEPFFDSSRKYSVLSKIGVLHMSGIFDRRTEDWWHDFLSHNNELLYPLAMHAEKWQRYALWYMFSVEEFRWRLYWSKIHKEVKRPRWFLFSKGTAKSKNLPSTFGFLSFYNIYSAYKRKCHTQIVIAFQKTWWKIPTSSKTLLLLLIIRWLFKSLLLRCLIN